MYITITATDLFMGIDSYKVGQILYLKKDINNIYDDEAIKVVSEKNCTYGYVANSVSSVARGTHSAGYIYGNIKEDTKCKVLFITEHKVIAEVLEDNK